jgi:hypothetical protein
MTIAVLRRAIVALGLVVLCALPASAIAKPVRPGMFAIPKGQGAVLVRIGPVIGKKARSAPLYIWRFDRRLGELMFSRSRAISPIRKGETVGEQFGLKPYLVGTDRSVFVAIVSPGEYVIHGTQETCFCLGSYAFTVEPDQVTDLGSVLIASEGGIGAVPELASHRLSSDLIDRPFTISSIALVIPFKDGDPVPVLGASRVVPANYRADVRFPNRGPVRIDRAGGLLINRLANLSPPSNGDGQPVLDAVRALPDPSQSGLSDILRPVRER